MRMYFRGVVNLLPQIIIMEFIKKFMTMNNKKANVRIKHLLYGRQKLNKCILRPFSDEECIGLIMNDGERKYITMDELRDVYIDDLICILKSDVMEVQIIIQ